MGQALNECQDDGELHVAHDSMTSLVWHLIIMSQPSWRRFMINKSMRSIRNEIIYRGLDFASSTERDSLPASAQDTERHEAPDGDAVDASEQSDEGSSLHEDDDVPIAQVRKALEQQRRAPKTESRKHSQHFTALSGFKIGCNLMDRIILTH